MKTLLTLATFLSMSPLAHAGDLEGSDPARLPPPPPGAVGWPSRDPNLDVRAGFLNPPPGYGEVGFYWWLGDPLTRERLTWQLDKLAEAKGVNGLQVNYAHSDRGGRSYGLTYPSEPPLFSEAWWQLFRWFGAEAKKRGMAASLSDYTLGVPGQGWWIDEILKENPSLCGSVLQSDSRQVSGGTDLAWELPAPPLNLTAYRQTGDTVAADGSLDLRRQLTGRSLHWRAPEGRWKVVSVWAQGQPMSLDPMNPLAGKKVIEKFFQRFEERCPGEAGKGLNFFFSDELDFGVSGKLWNGLFAAEFRKRKGYDLIPELPALFLDTGPRTPKVRLDYSDVLVALSEENYFRPLFQWHHQRGMIYGCDHGGRGRNVVEFGDYFRTQRWMPAPGCDSPGPSADVVKNKVASSIAHLYQRPRTWLEGFHSSGWGTTTAQLTDATFRNFVMGHNLLTLHGLYYSTHGGWWEWAPPCNHFRMPYWAHMKEFLACTQRLSYLLSQGHHRCDVAILYPVAPMEAGLGGNEAVQAAFGLAEHLFPRGIDFDFIDFESLARAKVEKENGELCVSGERYRVLILPTMRAVRYSTLVKAREFFRGGGVVINLGPLPEASERVGRDDPQLQALVKEIFGMTAKERNGQSGRHFHGNPTGGGLGILLHPPADVEWWVHKLFPRDFGLVSAGAQGKEVRPQVLHRKIGPRDVYLVYGAPRNSECFFRAKGKVELWDPWTGEIRPVPVLRKDDKGFGTIVRMPLEATEAQLIVFSPGESPECWISDLDEVTEVTGTKGKFIVRGLARTAGKKMVRVGQRTYLFGNAPAPPPTLKLDGPWEFELKPTLDNRFGDFHWPPTPGFIGPEARRPRYADEIPPNKDGSPPESSYRNWPQVTCSFGPQFWKFGPLPVNEETKVLESRLAGLDRVDPSNWDRTKALLQSSGRLYDFSWRWGLEHDPGHQGYHGLKEEVSDDFIALGEPRLTSAETVYEPEKKGKRYLLWTSVYSQQDGPVAMLLGGLRPTAVWLNGKQLEKIGGQVALKKGSNPLLLRYDSPGRGHIVFRRGGVSSQPAEDSLFSAAAQWIWYPQDQAIGDRFFRRTFSLTSVPASARLRITCDNGYTVFINGHEVGFGQRWETVQEYEVGRWLQPRKNLLTVAAHNDGGPAGLIAELTLGGPGKEEQRLATGEGWRCSLAKLEKWQETDFDDSKWVKTEVLSSFAGSLWAQHPQGPPRLEGPAPAPPSQPRPLAMRWFGDPEVLPFDVQPGVARPAGWYQFQAPPGVRGMTFSAQGRVRVWVAGKEVKTQMTGKGAAGSGKYRVALEKPDREAVPVALRIEQERGHYGGAALPEPMALDCGPGRFHVGDWSEHDSLASYSGGAWYRRTVSLTPEQVRCQVRLNLGAVAASAEVNVNGSPAGVRLAPPWTFDISRLVRAGDNRIEILVYNTLANHYLTIPTRYRGPLVSGLLGPVTIEMAMPVVLRKDPP